MNQNKKILLFFALLYLFIGCDFFVTKILQ